jgi:dihydrofolate reductase
MKLSIIYARSENRCIGKQGQIPWRLPDEFAHFKKTTLGKPIIMGRRTYEDHKSALPGRLNIVVTRQPDYRVATGVEVCTSLEAACERAQRDSNELFIVGGVRLFEMTFPCATTVYETIVHTEVEAGDTFLPAFDFSNFERTKLFEHAADERHAFAFTAYRYERCSRG